MKLSAMRNRLFTFSNYLLRAEAPLSYYNLLLTNVGKDVVISKDVKIRGGKNVEIGDYTRINAFSFLIAGKHSRIVIGKSCAIGYHVHMRTTTPTTSSYLRPSVPEGEEVEIVEKSIVVGDNVWIGAYSFIKEGVTIGSNAVIGAHSVVTRDVAANSVVVGSPARVRAPIMLLAK